MTARKELFFVCFSDNHLETVEEKRKSCVLSASHHYNKGFIGVFNMRGMWVIFYIMFMSVASAAETFSAMGAPVCGYGQYRQNATCYTYDDANDSICQGRSVSGTACLNQFVNTSAEIKPYYPFDAGFSAIGYATNFESTVGGACGGNGVTGTSCLNQFVNTSAEIDGLYPFSAGFSAIGGPFGTYASMRDNDCLGTMDGYYAIDMNKYAKLSNYKCSGTMTPYEILNDCQNIDMSIADASDTRSPLHPDNYMCGVLCDTGLVYTGTGACSQHCITDGTVRYLHVLRDGTHIKMPLYTDALTTPALHIQLGADTVCHVNLSTESAPNVINVNYKGKRYYSTK